MNQSHPEFHELTPGLEQAIQEIAAMHASPANCSVCP